jgi:hypothetical protein
VLAECWTENPVAATWRRLNGPTGSAGSTAERAYRLGRFDG